jgi:hypothetical protein
MSIKLNKNPSKVLRVGTHGPNGRKLRTIAAVVTIIFSVGAGIALIGASDRSVTLWGVARDLGIGSSVHEGDLVLRRAHLDRATNIYLDGSYQPIGLYVSRTLRAGELLPATAVAKNDGLAARRIVSVEIESHHLPSDIARGDLVDLYVTPRGTGGEILGTPERVISDVVVDAIETDPNSTHVGVALSMLDVDVPAVVEAGQRGHLDLVGRR